MTRRQELERHRDSLVEIREIMNSMKTLAYLETHKLQNILAAEHTIVDDIESVARDFLEFHRDVQPVFAGEREVFVVIGSERGFCGDFNQALVRQLQAALDARGETNPHLVIAVGHKLHSFLESHPDVAHLVAGANAVEEGVAVLNQVVELLGSLQPESGMLQVSVIHHNNEDKVVTRKLLPPFEELLEQPPGFSEPPLLQISPDAFLSELTDAYLFATLQEVLNTSLMAENHRRVQHMDSAVNHLDQLSEEIQHRCHAMRQEEITEEIEVILLNASNLSGRT